MTLESLVVDEIFLENVLNLSNISHFDLIEIHGVAYIGELDKTDVCMDDHEPDFYSVFLHYIPADNNGGLECIADFSNLEKATVYANQVAAQYRLRVVNYCL